MAGDARLSVKVSADAKEASAAFASLAKDIKAVGTESIGVTDGVARVDAAMAKLAKAPDTARALAMATAKARVEIEDLRAALDKTPASAEKMKAIQAALAQADAAIEKTIQRAGKLRESQEEVAQKMGLTAKGAEALGGSLGSVTGVMGKMADSSSVVAQGVAKAGFAVVAAGQAFKLGYEAGEQFRAGLQAIGVTVPDLSDKMGKLVVGIERTVRGYKDSELVESAAMTRARQIIALREAQAASEQSLGKAMAASGLVWKDANAERDAVVAKLNAAELALSRLSKSEQAWTEAIKVNTPELQKLKKEAEEHGIALEKVAPRTSAAAAAAEKFAESTKKSSDATREATEAERAAVAAAEAVARAIDEAAAAYDRQAAAVDRSRAKESAAQNFSTKTVGEFREVQFAAVGAAAAAGKFGDDLDRVAGIVAKTGGQMVVGAPVFISYAMASDEVTDALKRQAEAHRALTAAQSESLSATKGWTDYLIALKEGYDNGVTSLGSYIQQLIAFKAQITQMFAGATGEAAKAVQALQALVEDMMQNVGTRDPGSGNRMLDQLNRAIEAEKARKGGH